MDAHDTVTVEEGDRYPLRPPKFLQCPLWGCTGRVAQMFLLIKGENMTELTLGRVNFGPLNRALIGFDQLFDALEYKSATNYPPYNIVKSDDDNYVIEIAVAGFKKKEITIEVDNNKLSVKGSKEKQDTKTQYLHHALSARNFTHQFTIAENMVIKSATLEDGILQVFLERVVPESKKVRTIQIVEPTRLLEA